MFFWWPFDDDGPIWPYFVGMAIGVLVCVATIALVISIGNAREHRWQCNEAKKFPTVYDQKTCKPLPWTMDPNIPVSG